MSPQPIPKYIERLALQIAGEEAERARVANTLEGAQEIADRLEAESAAAGFTSVKEYIEDLTRRPEGVTPAEGTHPASAFWSHGTEHPQAPLNWNNEHFLENRYIAEAWARTQNNRVEGSAQTLETTSAGRRLNSMYLFQDQVREALGGETDGYSYTWARECWGNISQTYAEAADGPVVVFAETAHTRSILYRDELPTLHANQHVGLENINFAYSAPQGWSSEARAELGTNEVRAQVQVDDPSLPHYVDPAVYATQDPAVRRAALDAECASVTAERTARTEHAKHAETGIASGATEPDGPVPATSEVQAEEPAPRSAAHIPVWQVGFKPTPVKMETAPSGPMAESTAPPEPALGKQTSGTGLG
ncbi:hypothetical protein ABT090_32890 [Streptomyces asoensis]|uniref:hypothetical protein n=1 Tax=Streptomyces asoensis TaxID=249586 RepID=UPI0033259ED6